MNKVRIFICGDIVNHTPGVDFVGRNLAGVIEKADYAVCNLEGPELELGVTKTCPHQDPGTIEYLKNIGFNMMLLANNHITELGEDGVNYSINKIRENGLDYVGAGLSWEETYSPKVKVINGLRIGFVNICEAQSGQLQSPEQSFGYAWMGYEKLFEDVKELANITDKVIVFVHAGLEHYPVPLPEIREFYKKLCDNGAAAVIGGHPHAAQGFEYYGKKLIIYSLGNFFFPHKRDDYPNENISYSVVLEFEENVSITPVHHRQKDGVVEILTEKSLQINLDYLCGLLKEDYKKYANNMCLSAYKNLICHLLASATFGEYPGMPIKQRLTQIARKLLFHKHYVSDTQHTRDLLLLRLFENESYRWTITRALKISGEVL